MVFRSIGIATLAVAVMAATHAAEPPHAKAVRERLEQQLEKPSVHGERDEIDRALAEAGVTEDRILALHHAVSQADLPTMTGSLDAFLFFTRDPHWQSYRQFFAEFLAMPEVATIDAATMRMFADYDGVLTLPAITELSPKEAAACRHFGQGGWGAAIEFPNVSALSPEAAKQLARCEALLVFPHLRELSLDTARMLATSKGTGLILGGLPTVAAEVANALSTIAAERGLLLPDLVALDSVPLAKRFARQDHAFFPAVRGMTPEIARALRGNEGGELSLPSLETVTPELAKEFVGAGYYWLSLGGAANVTPGVASILAEHHGQLVFPGHDCFSAQAAEKLATHEHGIILPHVARIPAEVLAAMAPHEGPLVLGSVSSLTPAEAAGIAKHAGPVSLPVLERLTPETATILAPRLGDIEVPALASLDAKTAAALAAHAVGQIVLVGITDLTPDAAAALAAFDGSLFFPGISKLTAETAAALAPHRGTLALNVTEDLEIDVIAQLATHAGDLRLPGMSRLSAEAGKLLALAPGRLDIPSVSQFEHEAAAALLARTKPLDLDAIVHTDSLDSTALAELIVKHFADVTLHNVTSLTGLTAADVAQVLVRARGTLSLPSLERVSPRALEILLARPGMQLPDLANVTIVPEPGQLGHDDYVEPKP